ncbi:histidinol-phosphatase HisJ [Clostridium sp. HMP27]|uniref:histidinol-phosphatase HisJ n=1 Tax=Clostridium sp. HMP27 TaxID=1487921 RepID=UPI00052CB191|nr:histidinol-phosphatase HisJ [Clostridium sp. HMP27]KGK88601.1 histidinol phosphate phosphatase [Clostridium sp. HMP27]
MNYSNYHTHCFFCDGKGGPEDYIKRAISLNFHSLGFSSHAPVHVPSSWTMKEENLNNYVETIKRLKERYKNQIQIYCGLEIDYFPGVSGPDSEKFKGLELDYTIGSIHFMKNKDTGEYLTVDGDEEEYTRIIEVFFKGDVQAFVAEYYGLIRGMLSIHNPHIVGHLDLIRKNNKNERYFNETEDWYKEEVIKTLRAIKNSGAILEVNTGAISRGYLTTPYPSPWILEECYELDIPITLNSDGHSPENLDAFFDESLNMLRYAGYRQIYFMNNKRWITRSI